MKILRKLYIYKKINAIMDDKIHSLEIKYQDKLYKIQNELQLISNENINLRLKIKKNQKEKINIVFVCHRPAIWNSLKSVYNEFKSDKNFNVIIVTIPNKKQLKDIGLYHEIYETEGAEDFWRGEDVVSGYNYEKKEWLDLRTLNPDYIFFQQPYNIQRCPSYQSCEVSKYAKICYVEYGYQTNLKLSLECLPADFISNVSLFFLQNKTEEKWYNDYFKEIKNTFTKMYVTGFPRFDNLTQYKNSESSNWKNDHNNKFRIIWTPRWTTNENNCHFFKYKNDLFQYGINNQDKIDLIFRPHPQAFLNWLAEGELNEKEIKDMEKLFYDSKNLVIDKSKEYLTTFYSSDCLITDYSSVVPEYFLTGKPILYCINENAIYNIEGNITQGFYMIHNWKELENTLENLQNGIDPLKEVRHKLIQTEFLINQEGAGKQIFKLIQEDANK